MAHIKAVVRGLQPDSESDRRRPVQNSRKLSVGLWIVQGLLALFFALASGAPKLLLPPETLPMPIPLPGAFIRFIGVGEVLGALGLILPGLTHILPVLTPLAAVGLVVVTVSATVYQLMAGQVGNAIFAFVMSLLCAFVAYGRWRM